MSSPAYIPEIPSLIPYAIVDHGYLQEAEKEIYQVAREHSLGTRWHNLGL